MTKNKPLELYFHIPFCVRKCLYCDFLSAAHDKTVQDAYMKALLAEVVGRANECAEYEVKTIFIGGGTPSVVDAAWIEKLLAVVREHFCMAEDAEISMEVNPGTVDLDKLLHYRRAGVNRLSIGLQSVSDEELKTLGRIHTFSQFMDTYAWSATAGFCNCNVDIMSALPGQTTESYKETLARVLALNPPPKHISAYSLIVEEGTPFAELNAQKKLCLPEEETEREMYWDTYKGLMEAGYEHYEISNYAMPGYACRHNIGYWKRSDYLGFGIGAASLMENCRFSNESDLEKYIEAPLNCRGELVCLTVEEQMEEFMFLGLRMIEGICVREFEEKFGEALWEVYGSVIDKNIRDGLLHMSKDGAYLALTERGIDISNYVLAQFLF
ncbi:MAG: oxygen-independent coproporphyrinogen III oxidase [Lachnospiraceae bacterium]|nr:oxygen-independent coproporphyrinogen III oxidase [Lachnospiraceae bacterium]